MQRRPYDPYGLQAVALRYDGRRAPFVTAKGDAELAQRIIEEARRQGVHITEDPQLLALLARLDLDQEIPPALYSAVAVVLSWVYWLQGLEPEDARELDAGRNP
jgi:flagellar biosynthesis protein